MRKTYLVYGWRLGADYEAQKPHDYSIKITARSEGEADDKGDKEINKRYNKCDVIYSVEQVRDMPARGALGATLDKLNK